jgi:GcrA cell cycle regulator
MSWTEEKVELLRQLWLDGKSASQISAALGAGLTRNAVIGKVHRLGLAGRAKSPTAQSAVCASGAVRAPTAVRRAAARPAAAMAGATMVRGNTALAVAADSEYEAQPTRHAEEIVVPMSLKVTIVDLKESMCKWPLGDPTSPDFRYCGSPAYGGSPYCQHHGKLAYQPVQDRRRERDRERRLLLK